MTRTKATIYLVGVLFVSAGAAFIHWPAGLIVFGIGLIADARTKEPKPDA